MLTKKYTIVFFSIVFILLSCESKNGSADKYSGLVSIDTVLIEPGGQLVMAADNMFLSGFSNDLSKLYHYDTKNGEIEVIDLDLLKLEKKLKVAQEGPDGVGTVSWFDYWNDSLFVFYNFAQLGFLNHDMKKVRSIDLRNSSLIKMVLGEGFGFRNSFSLLNSANKVLVPVESFDNDFLHLAFIDFESEGVKIIKNSRLEKVNDYKVRHIQGNSYRSIIQPIGILSWDNKVYIFNKANNDIFQFLPESKELLSVNVGLGQIPSGKSKYYRLETESIEEFESQFFAMQEEIGFQKLVIDRESGNFYRIAERKVVAAFEDAPAKWDVFLLKYDPEFKLLAEVKILDRQPLEGYKSDYFVKDGMVWLRININDELAFIRIKVT
ncbi:DUF4221 family protein [Cecembia rubra]|uniref:Uncharacterized protein DUF4221 n=1 Tax=Cecembia rubra TaxID=1485585 RepID=A0A2P8E4S6_9BACT|nr:DUF4221 family protein [Cecembia rubra]PSL04478.1 uncharacterized protein DUF4221 [Cecembia rubra]